MNKLVTPMQSSFVSSRHITDNIIITQEIAYSMPKMKGNNGYMPVKVDVEKAYDRLSWEFIMDTLFDIGIPGHLISIVMKCLTSTTMQVSWNGELSTEFKPTRGVRQGDPLSPYIFVLCMERLSRLILNEVNVGRWEAMRLGQNGSLLSHLFFADDLVLFAKANTKQVRVIEEILNLFCDCSGLSNRKSVVFFFPQCPIVVG